MHPGINKQKVLLGFQGVSVNTTGLYWCYNGAVEFFGNFDKIQDREPR